MLRTIMDRDSPDAPPATLWVLDARGSRALAGAFEALLHAPELRVYQVPMKAAAFDSPVARDLRAGHGLSAASRWALVAEGPGAPLAQGEVLPAAGSFAATLEGAGFRDRAKELQAFLKRNPDRLDAREQLLAVLRARGEEAAMGFMGVRVESLRDRLEKDGLAAAMRPEKADLQGAKPLTPVQDLEAWSAFTQELDSDFRTGRWRGMDLDWTREGRALDASSPTLQGLYLRWIPAVEAALRENPSSESLWALWCWMSEATGGRRLGPLLALLRSSPLTPRRNWPPPSAARLLMAIAKSPEDWSALKAHFEAVWEDGTHPLIQKPTQKSAPLICQFDWDDTLAPLVECCLRSGARDRADALVRQAAGASQWAALPAMAAALAARCGDKALAARWAALGATK